MKNWLEQDLQIGDYVHRGAREGNGSSYRIGQIIKFAKEQRVQVQWLFEAGSLYDPATRVSRPYIRRLDTKGTGVPEGMILLDKTLVQDVESRCMAAELHSFLQHRNIYSDGYCWAKPEDGFCWQCQNHLDNLYPSVV